MDINEREHHLRTFEAQLYDSVYLLYFAFDINQKDYDDDVIRPLIRASVLNTILLLETSANCLIDALDLPNKFYNDIEKFPFLSKFEYFLERIKPEKTFDRGCQEVQAITELKSIRDFYVHPKVKKSKYERIGENMWDTYYGQTQQLQFPRDPSKWTREHAILALKSVNNFFNIYFIEWCNYKPDLVVDILLSSDKVNLKNPVGAAIDCVDGLNRAVKDWGIDFQFIGKNV